MAASTLGLIPRENPFYSFTSSQILPVCLVLLLIGTDLAALTRLGWPALRLMLAGSAGTLIGAFAAYALYRKELPAGSSGAVGALAGSWIGGSANMLAVKEALGVSDSLIGPVILVDALVAYSWMALLVAASAWQDKWDRAVRSPKGTPALTPRLSPSQNKPRWMGTRDVARAGVPFGIPRPDGPLWFALTLAVVLSLLAQAAARRLPILSGIAASTWTILLVTTAALILSATPFRRLGSGLSSRLGTWLLYLLLITIGARANLQAVVGAPLFLLMGLTWIAIHGAVLLAAGFFWKAPLGLIATASQANIGGAISAPIVGATYSKELAGMGLLMAVLGNILGTYLGLLTYAALRAFT